MGAAKEILIVRTGSANLASVMAGFSRLGVSARITESPAEVRQAERLVLPGVGAFGAAVQSLSSRGLLDPLRDRILEGKRTLCICLGLQLLCTASEESPGVPGLGVIDREVRRFPSTVRVPQLGWNEVIAPEESRTLRTGHAYFANSFRLLDAPSDWAIARSDHGGPFAAALERGEVLACQFHPELSGRWGAELLRRWLGSDQEPT